MLALDKSFVKRLSFPKRSGAPREVANPSKTSYVATINARVEAVDYRLVLVGSMLPDVIDKPLGMYLLRDTFSSGRIFGHTLLFFLILLGIGLYLCHRYRWLGGIVLSLCSGLHLVLDQMWRSPKTLFWPILGLSFGKYDLSNWLPGMWEALMKEPAVYVSEIAGLIILMLFGVELLRNKKVLTFLRSGVV